jgi:hypothetical protein
MTWLSLLAADSARVYVYARWETPARSWLPISCDGEVVAKLKQGTLFAIDVTPGRHNLGSDRGVPVFVDVRSGDEVFVRLD